MLAYLEENRNYLENELKTRFPKAKFTHLESTYLQWVDFRAYGDNIDARFFKKNAKVFLTDGKNFGGEGYVRINFATRREIITQALDRMEKAFAEER